MGRTILVPLVLLGTTILVPLVLDNQGSKLVQFSLMPSLIISLPYNFDTRLRSTLRGRKIKGSYAQFAGGKLKCAYIEERKLRRHSLPRLHARACKEIRDEEFILLLCDSESVDDSSGVVFLSINFDEKMSI